MKIKITPSALCGSVSAPPSKSMAHRMLIGAGLCCGKSIVRGIEPSEDILATLDCLEQIGASYIREGNTVVVNGAGGIGASDERELYCRESGSTLRFFIPICLLEGKKTVFKGTEKLLSRPLNVYETICKAQGIEYVHNKNELTVKGKISGGTYKVQGNISSQFISGLLFALPLLEKDSTIDIIPPIESSSYINLTIQTLSMFGVKVSWADERTLHIPGGQKYIPRDVTVEGDYSNGAFFEALNYLGHNVSVEGLKSDSIQGDRVYREYFPMLEKGTPTIHLSDCPDLGPVLFAVAAAKHGGVFNGTRRLKIKESDRGTAMAEELKKFGVSVRIEEDTIVVYPADFHTPDSVLCGHNDHRIVMSLSILLTMTGGVIEGAEAVKKSLPDFFDKLIQLGAKVEEL